MDHDWMDPFPELTPEELAQVNARQAERVERLRAQQRVIGEATFGEQHRAVVTNGLNEAWVDPPFDPPPGPDQVVTITINEAGNYSLDPGFVVRGSFYPLSIPALIEPR